LEDKLKNYYRLILDSKSFNNNSLPGARCVWNDSRKDKIFVGIYPVR
jgi:hypothetical protein